MRNSYAWFTAHILEETIFFPEIFSIYLETSQLSPSPHTVLYMVKNLLLTVACLQVL